MIILPDLPNGWFYGSIIKCVMRDLNRCDGYSCMLAKGMQRVDGYGPDIEAAVHAALEQIA